MFLCPRAIQFCFVPGEKEAPFYWVLQMWTFPPFSFPCPPLFPTSLPPPRLKVNKNGDTGAGLREKGKKRINSIQKAERIPSRNKKVVERESQLESSVSKASRVVYLRKGAWFLDVFHFLMGKSILMSNVSLCAMNVTSQLLPIQWKLQVISFPRVFVDASLPLYIRGFLFVCPPLPPHSLSHFLLSKISLYCSSAHAACSFCKFNFQLMSFQRGWGGGDALSSFGGDSFKFLWWRWSWGGCYH